jgi:hypothetical protein
MCSLPYFSIVKIKEILIFWGANPNNSYFFQSLMTVIPE